MGRARLPTGRLPPPKKKRSLLWLWIVLGIVVVLAGATAITGFVTPGFFLDKNYPVGASPTLREPQFMNEFLFKVNSHDLDGAAAYVCESADESPASLIHGHFADPNVGNYRVFQVEPQGGITLTVLLDATFRDDPANPRVVTLILRQGPDGGYCQFGVID
jgi:hypothetical protein